MFLKGFFQFSESSLSEPQGVSFGRLRAGNYTDSINSISILSLDWSASFYNMIIYISYHKCLDTKKGMP